MIASTLSSRPISGKGLRVALYRVVEVRDITRSSLICPRVVINWSVMPSAKYACDESAERLSRGSTAREWIGGGASTEASRLMIIHVKVATRSRVRPTAVHCFGASDHRAGSLAADRGSLTMSFGAARESGSKTGAIHR